MEYWCCKKNSIFEMMKDPENYNTALVPCIGPECPKWKEWESRGGCHYLIKSGRKGRQ
jgi:hypothetical protein